MLCTVLASGPSRIINYRGFHREVLVIEVSVDILPVHATSVSTCYKGVQIYNASVHATHRWVVNLVLSRYIYIYDSLARSRMYIGTWFA